MVARVKTKRVLAFLVSIVISIQITCYPSINNIDNTLVIVASASDVDTSNRGSYRGLSIDPGSEWYSSDKDDMCKKIMKGLMDRGFTKNAAAGATGNFWLESGLDPANNVDNASADACGLPMWTDGADCHNKTDFLNYCSSKGLDPKDLDVQLDYLCEHNDAMWERTPNGLSADEVWGDMPGDSRSKIKGVTDFAKVDFKSPEQAAEVWLWWHEFPALYGSHAISRLQAAKKAYELAEGSSGDSKSSSDSSSGGKSSDGGYIDDNGDWVAHKDDWRHGIEPGESSKDTKVKYEPGMANGTYVKSINGKNYYWYHQTTTNDKCEFCGTWTSMFWGKDGGSGSSTLGHNGGSIYASAMLVSNLTNSDVTPNDILEAFGCKITDGKKKCKTKDSEVIDDVNIKSNGALESAIASKYSLSHTEEYSNKSDDEIIKMIDDTLDKHGVVLYRFKSDAKASSGWPFSKTASQYVIIVDKTDEGYIVLDSCCTEEQMGTAVKKDDILKNRYKDSSNGGGLIQGWWNDTEIWLDNGGGFTSGKVYSDAASIGKYKNKIKVGSLNGDDFYIYDGLPWDYESGTYACDLIQAAIEVEEYVKSVSKNKTPKFALSTSFTSVKDYVEDTTSWARARMTNQKGYPVTQGDGWKNAGGCVYITIDGVNCVPCGLPPMAVDPNYCDGFANGKEWLTRSCSSDMSLYGYGKRKMVAVLKDISGGSNNGKIYYMPICQADAKAHTFPGGAAQTGYVLSKPIKTDSSGKPVKIEQVYIAENSKDYGRAVTNRDWSELMDVTNIVAYHGKAGTTAWDCMYSVGEFTSAPTEVANTVITSGNYKMIGVIGYPAKK